MLLNYCATRPKTDTRTLSLVSHFSLTQWMVNDGVYILDDHSRVVLDQQDKLKGSDYINASHIDVSYIAC